MSDALCLYVIYDSPLDYPGKHVLRRWTVIPMELAPDPEPLAVVDTLEEARTALPVDGLVNIGRYLEDEPQIVEVWI